MISGGYYINPEPQLLPAYRISPFDNEAAHLNRKPGDPGMTDEFFTGLFGNDVWQYTLNGRMALGLALRATGIKAGDVVTILTTSGNFYISGCVTSEIEKVCRWSREFLPETKAILVNHEFGFPFEGLTELKSYGIPIIEDCAHAFASQNSERSVGHVGDHVIYSLPKYFPVQIGGILKSKTKIKEEAPAVTSKDIHYLRNALSHYLEDQIDFAPLRITNYGYFSMLFGHAGLETRFNLTEHTVPGVFMFRLRDRDDGEMLKHHLRRNGVESSVLYRENTVFIPVHHRLKVEDMDYIYHIIAHFLKL